MRGVAVLSFLLTLLFTPVVIWALNRFRVIDVPGERSSHRRPTPRGGGMGVVLGAVTGVIIGGAFGVSETWSIKTLLVCVVFFAIVGFIDDVRTLEVKPRLLAQAACAVVFVGPWFFAHAPIGETAVRLVLAGLAIVWVIGYLNAFNFMDGINGISGTHTVLAGATFAWIGHFEHQRLIELCGVTIAAAAAGFLPYNFPRARVFLGDVGSYFIGTWIAITALIALEWSVPIEAVLGALVIYLVDTSSTLVRRIWRRANWRESHHEHVYQRLIDLGWPHTRTTLTVLAFSTCCAALGLVSLQDGIVLRVLADVVMVGLALGYTALPRALGDRGARSTDAVGDGPAAHAAPTQPEPPAPFEPGRSDGHGRVGGGPGGPAPTGRTPAVGDRAELGDGGLGPSEPTPAAGPSAQPPAA